MVMSGRSVNSLASINNEESKIHYLSCSFSFSSLNFNTFQENRLAAAKSSLYAIWCSSLANGFKNWPYEKESCLKSQIQKAGLPYKHS